jgi:hypothetical protein
VIEFRTSSFCTLGDCVEVGVAPDRVLVRDTKDRTAGTLEFTADEWRSFLDAVKSGAHPSA